MHSPSIHVHACMVMATLQPSMHPHCCPLFPSPQNEMKPAREEFMRASQLDNNKRKNVVGHLALAAVMYNAKQYREALQL